MDELKRAFKEEIEELAESKRNLEARLADNGVNTATLDQYKKKLDDFTKKNQQLEEELRRVSL